MKLNYVTYESNTAQTPTGLVAYLLCGGLVVYSGLMPAATSTINSAERIVQAISEKEKADWRRITFVDMQTRRCYPRLAKFEHELSALVFDDDHSRPSVKGWRPLEKGDLPEGCVELFDALPWYEDTPSTKLEDLTS